MNEDEGRSWLKIVNGRDAFSVQLNAVVKCQNFGRDVERHVGGLGRWGSTRRSLRLIYLLLQSDAIGALFAL